MYVNIVHDNCDNLLVQLLSSHPVENYSQMQRSYLVKWKGMEVGNEREKAKDSETTSREVRMKRRYNGLRDRELITHKSQSNYNGRRKEKGNGRDLS